MMQEVLTKIARIEATSAAILIAVTEQRDALKEHARQDHADFAAINTRVGAVERKQSWFVGAWTVVVILIGVSVAFLKDVLTP